MQQRYEKHNFHSIGKILNIHYNLESKAHFSNTIGAGQTHEFGTPNWSFSAHGLKAQSNQIATDGKKPCAAIVKLMLVQMNSEKPLHVLPYYTK